MDKETLIEMMRREYPSSYEGVKDRLDTMSLKEISDMMEFLDMTFDKSSKPREGIMATDEAMLVSDDSRKNMTVAERDPLLVEEYEKYVFDMLEQGLEPMSFEMFRSAAIAGEAKAPVETEEVIKEKKVISLAEGGRVGFDNGGGIFSINPDEAVKFNLDGETINLNPKFFEMFMKPFMDNPEKFKRRIDDLKQEIRRNQKTVALAEGGLSKLLEV